MSESLAVLEGLLRVAYDPEASGRRRREAASHWSDVVKAGAGDAQVEAHKREHFAKVATIAWFGRGDQSDALFPSWFGRPPAKWSKLTRP